MLLKIWTGYEHQALIHLLPYTQCEVLWWVAFKNVYKHQTAMEKQIQGLA